MSRDVSSPLLSLTEFRQLQWLLGSLLVMISAGTVLFLEVEAWGLLATLLACALVVVVRADLPARLPRWFHRLAFPFMLLLLAWDLWGGEGLLPALVRLSLWLLLYRSLCHRRRREELQMILLGLFLIVVAGVLTVSMAFSFLLVLFTLCALALLLVSTTADSLAAATAEQDSWYRGYSLPRVLARTFSHLDWRQAGLWLGLFCVLMGASSLIFVSIPRFQIENGLFLERLFPRKASTGFSDSIRFGEVTDISRNTNLAFTLDLPPGEAPPAGAYFRMQVLDEYVEGGGFSASAALRREAFYPERSLAFIEGPPRIDRAPPEPWTIYLEPGVSRYLPLPASFTRVRLRDALVLRHSPTLCLVQLRDEPLSMLPYRIEGWKDEPRLEDKGFLTRLQQFSSGVPQRLARRHFLELPPDADSRAELARLLAASKLEGLPARDFAPLAAAWLGRQHSYALQSALEKGRGDALVRWMASSQPGHCEFFASSFVLLARAAGHPARVVVGFRGGSWNPLSNSLGVRFSDAHAWSEIWDGRSAWLRVDPTPGAGSATTAEQAALVERGARTGWSSRVEALRIMWYRRIVNFDQQSQVDALVSLKNSLRDLREWLRNFGQATRERFSSLVSGKDALTLVFMGCAFVGLAALLSWLALRFRRHWRWALPSWLRFASRGDPVRREAGRLLRRLRLAGRADDPLWNELERLRYGHRDTWPAPAAVFQRASRLLSRRPRS